MKKIIYIGFLALLLGAFGACTARFNEVRVTDYRLDKVEMAGASKVLIDAALKIKNPTKRNIRLKSAEFDVLHEGTVVARLHLLEPVNAPPQSEDFLSLPLELRITNLLALLNMDINIRQPDLSQLTVSGVLKVKAGMWSKTLTVKNTTLQQALGLSH